MIIKSTRIRYQPYKSLSIAKFVLKNTLINTQNNRFNTVSKLVYRKEPSINGILVLVYFGTEVAYILVSAKKIALTVLKT